LSSLPKERKDQSLYDAVADRSYYDRFINPTQYDRRTGKHRTTKAVAPESVLLDRIQQKLKRKGERIQAEDVDTTLSQLGLAIPSERNEALPDSVGIL